MPRQRSPDREKAEQLYLESSGKLKLKDIAEKLNLPEGTIRGWKNKDHWDDKLNGTLQSKGAKNTERSKRKKGAQPGNKNAIGNTGGAPKKNGNAEIHGFFTKYLPEETAEIIEQVEDRSPIDMLWDQIVIQYTAIIRAQRIMYVKEQDDLTKELKKTKTQMDTVGPKDNKKLYVSYREEEYELQFAWDKQANFLKAQSRAMAELRNMIAKYDEMIKSDLATEEQRLRIQKLKAEIKATEKNDPNKPVKIKVTLVDDDD